MLQGINTDLAGLLTNQLPTSAADARWLVGILGDHPSQYSISPGLWNAAFERLGLDAHYVPFDVSETNVERFMAALRASPRLLGINVTVPHKRQVLPHVDRRHPSVESIGAANCIVRTSEGELVAYNTDAEGALACLVRERPGAPAFFPNLADARVLQIGAGGAGRAVAAALVDELGDSGKLILANRTAGTASEVARAIDPQARRIEPLLESDLGERVAEVDLIINASTRGQAGFFQVGESTVTCLEPYSPLGPAAPAVIDTRQHPRESDRWAAWYRASLNDIRANERHATEVMERVRPGARFFDLIYAPAEPTLLRTARWSGHATLNGSDMILHQAVAGFLLIAAPLLGGTTSEARSDIETAMRTAQKQ